MQPTLPQSMDTADMDVTAIQSMNWPFKREQFYLLAQFLQQKASLAEKEVKDELSNADGTTEISENNENNDELAGIAKTSTSDIAAKAKLFNSVAAAITLHQNAGSNILATTPSPSPPPLLDGGGIAQNPEQQQLNICLNPKLFFNHAQQVMMMEAAAAAVAAVQEQHSLMHSPQSNNGNNKEELQQETNITEAMDCPESISTKDKLDEASLDVAAETAVHSKNNDAINDENLESEESQAAKYNQSSLNIFRNEDDKSTNANNSSLNSETQESTDNINDNSFNCSKISLNSTASDATKALNSTLSPTLLQQHQNLQNSSAAENNEIMETDELNGNENETFSNNMELLAAKNKEIKTLFEELKRLKAIEQINLLQIHRLDDHLNVKRHYITCLEAKLDEQQSNEAFEDVEIRVNANENKENMANKKAAEDDYKNANNNSACGSPTGYMTGQPVHSSLPPHGFLPNLPPYPLQDQGYYRFASNLQLPAGTSMAGHLGELLIPKADPMEAKLQEILRYNLDKYANKALNTLQISYRVKELLSVHNIGQRLFAKYVLGLSQGTVSELLSKPKTWERLTEKGRDSYRKMHAWSCDDNAVMLLKSVLPKRDSNLPPYGGHTSTFNADDSHSNEDSRSSHQALSPSPFFKEDNKLQNENFLNDSTHIIPEKMARFYKELMTHAPRDALPRINFRGLNPTDLEENMRLAYEQEMSAKWSAGLMAFQQKMLNGAHDLSLDKEKQDVNESGSSLNNTLDDSKENSYSEEKKSQADLENREQSTEIPAKFPSNNATISVKNLTAQSPLGNSILSPSLTSNDDLFAAANPLQKMASITNSLMTQPPVLPHHNSPQKPRPVLPPISQEQFDMISNLNTDDIVRRIKEALSQYSISQRLFGESVLGLSQGSVSDLLARPKPWHMLTQKGREPFIRMQMFLQDESAVHKLAASQYRIAPEKLIRTGSFNGPPQLPQGLLGNIQASQPMQNMMNELKFNESAHIMQQMQAAAVLSAAMQQHQQQAAQAAAVQHLQQQNAAQEHYHHQSKLLPSPALPAQHFIALPSTRASSQPNSGSSTPSATSSDKKSKLMSSHIPHPGSSMRGMQQNITPNVYEMAALTQDLDTHTITTKIKEALLTNNIGQKIFGEAVLGLSQGSVSELLSKPKPWHMLSIKGREPFIRMHLWLSDPNNVERLQMLKNEKRESSKRRRSTGANQQDNSDTSSNDTNDFYISSPRPGSVGSQGAPANKKQRFLFSEEQKAALILAFDLDPYPNVGTIEFLTNELGLATRTVTNWFHNHRMRLKQQASYGIPGQEIQIPTRENSNSTPFDPVQFRILLQQRLLELHKERMGLRGNTALPYPPYCAAAALLGQNLMGSQAAGMPTEEDLRALGQAFRQRMSGLDLTLNNFKQERTDDYEDDVEDSRLSENENDFINPNDTSLGDTLSTLNQNFLNNLRSNRRDHITTQWTDSDQENRHNSDNKHEQMQPSSMEPEVVIKEEKEDFESNSGQAISEERIKVVPEDKLRRA